MKDDFDLPQSAKTAFDKYPDLQPSAAFNRGVLERLEHENTRRKTTLIGQIEELLGLSLWRFAASGLLGAFVPALILGALLYSNRSHTLPTPPGDEFPPNFPQAQGATQFYAREWEFQSGFGATLRSQKPQKSVTPNPQGGEISCAASQSHLA